jgi:hypothetical protein
VLSLIFVIFSLLPTLTALVLIQSSTCAFYSLSELETFKHQAQSQALKSIIEGRNGGNNERDRNRPDSRNGKDRDRDSERGYTPSGWDPPVQSAWGNQNLDLDSVGRRGPIDLRGSLSGPSQLLRGNIFDDDAFKLDQTLDSDRFHLLYFYLYCLFERCG